MIEQKVVVKGGFEPDYSLLFKCLERGSNYSHGFGFSALDLRQILLKEEFDRIVWDRFCQAVFDGFNSLPDGFKVPENYNISFDEKLKLFGGVKCKPVDRLLCEDYFGCTISYLRRHLILSVDSLDRVWLGWKTVCKGHEDFGLIKKQESCIAETPENIRKYLGLKCKPLFPIELENALKIPVKELKRYLDYSVDNKGRVWLGWVKLPKGADDYE